MRVQKHFQASRTLDGIVDSFNADDEDYSQSCDLKSNCQRGEEEGYGRKQKLPLRNLFCGRPGLECGPTCPDGDDDLNGDPTSEYVSPIIFEAICLG